MSDGRRTARRLCGAVRLSVAGRLASASVCHCGQCRKMSGHHRASAVAPWTAISVDGEVTWFRSSQQAERGFCARCGSSPFWPRDTEDTQSFALGPLDGPTDLTPEKHIWTEFKADCYAIEPGTPQIPQQ